MPGSNFCILTCRHIFQEAGKVVWYSHLLTNFVQFIVINTVKGFDIVNKLLAMPSRATQDDGSWWRVLTKCGSLEMGMANHINILDLRTPLAVLKKLHLKMIKIVWKRRSGNKCQSYSERCLIKESFWVEVILPSARTRLKDPFENTITF